jgi:molybdopterin-containing oxidoreductase family membrane subunit
LVVAREVLDYKDYITTEHLDAMSRIVMLTGTLVGLAYITEFFVAAYSGVEYEQYAFINRATGPYWWSYWIMMGCNLLAPQVFWSRWARTTPWFLFVMSIIVNIGMWFERFVIIVTSLHRDFLPSSWTMYAPTIVEFSILLGSFGLFFFFFFLFMKFLPSINMAELKSIVKTKHAIELEKHYTELLNNNHKMPIQTQEMKGDSVHGN